MVVTCKDIVTLINAYAPETLAENWDNVGLHVGKPDGVVKKILVALDAREAVIEEAVKVQADMIVTHHPLLLFVDLKAITTDSAIGRKIYRLIENGIHLYCAHTSLDIAQGGTNDYLAELIGLKKVSVLDKTKEECLYSFSVYVPKESAEVVKEGLSKAGAGMLGNYKACFFSVEGKGEFVPCEGSQPFIGTKDRKEVVEEVKLEAVVSKYTMQAVLDAMYRLHPYEEVAFHIVKMEQGAEVFGIGRLGELEEAEVFEKFAMRVKKILGLNSMRIVGNKQKIIKKIAVCTGSGASFIKIAKKAGADCFISSDFKFHEMQEAQDLDLCLIDATHFASEVIIVPVLAEYIKKGIAEMGAEVEVLQSQWNGQTFLNI